MVSTSTTNPGILNIFSKVKNQPKKKKTLNDIRNSGYGKIPAEKQKASSYDKRRAASKKALNEAYTNYKKKKSSSNPSQSGDSSSSSSSGGGITSLDDAASDELGDSYIDGEESSSSGTGGTSPLLEGSMTFEEMIGEICNGIDLIFATKRSTVVITDYEGIYAEAKYLRSKNHESVKNEDIKLWQLEEGTYELDVAEYGFYNTVRVHYKDGVVTESYEDLVRVYGNVVIDYYETKIDKTTAQMKAKAYLAAHVRDFDMSIRANLLWDGDIDIGDIVTIENPLTMRDDIRVNIEERDPEYLFVMGKSIEWEGDTPITGTIELRYGAKSPENKDVPEAGTSYTKSSSGNTDIDSAIDEVGKMTSKISYSGACQTHDCVQQKQTGDCFGMSDFIACELKTRGVEARIKGYPTSVPEHRSVQYKDASGQWQNFPYRKYGCNTLFNDTSNIKNGHDVKCTCD